MKKILIRLVAIVFVLCTCVPLVGCSQRASQERSLYEIDVEFDEKAHKLDAKMRLTYVNNSDSVLDELYFHLYPNAYRKGAQFSPVDETDRADAYPNGDSWGGIEIKRVAVGDEEDYEIGGEDEDILIVPLKRELEPTQKTVVEIDFCVTVANVKHRLGYADGITNCGNWYPIACVKKEVGFDSYPYYSNGDPFTSDVADYRITVAIPSTLSLASSAKSERRDGGVVATYTCAADKVRDFAFVIGDFKRETAQVGGVEVNYYYKKDTDAQSTLKAACDALKYFSKEIYPYPYQSYSVVETPFLHGGMEYPALVYVSDSLNRSLATEAVIHETAHQWWYGIVGNNQVEHAWMDEGLAEYCTTLFYEFNPEYGVTYKARMADATGAYVIYSSITSSDGVMDKNVNEFTKYDYTYLTYLKGALMFDAVRKTVTDKPFFAALRRYAEENAFGIARPEDMIGSFERATERSLEQVFNSFLKGEAKIFQNVTATA